MDLRLIIDVTTTEGIDFELIEQRVGAAIRSLANPNRCDEGIADVVGIRVHLWEHREYHEKNSWKSPKLGKVQLAMLDALKRNKGWSVGCGWMWSTNHVTARYCEQLHAKGLVDKAQRKGFRGVTRDIYTINALGEAALEAAT